MFDKYLEKILPIPLVNVEVSKTDGYKYRITTYASVLDEYGIKDRIIMRLKNNKRIKDFDGWFLMADAPYLRQAIIEFKK